MKLRQSELPISVDFENQLSKSDNFATSNPNEIVNSRIKAEYDLSIWNERLRKKVIEKDMSILDLDIILKEQGEKYRPIVEIPREFDFEMEMDKNENDNKTEN